MPGWRRHRGSRARVTGRRQPIRACLNRHFPIRSGKMGLSTGNDHKQARMNKPTTPDALLLNPLTALSPLDGRYESKTAPLRPLFSESGLIRRRVLVEIRSLLALGGHKNIKEVPPFSPATKKLLEGIVANFSESDAHR